jgi:transposase
MPPIVDHNILPDMGRMTARLPYGRKNWTFAGSDDGGRRAAAIHTLIATAKLNGIDPQAWLADVLARLPDHPAKRIHDLLPWNWRRQSIVAKAA